MSEVSEIRAAKSAVVEEIQEKLANADSVIVTEYRGLTVDAISDLRSGLRTGGGKYKVYKNTLARLAADAAGTDAEFTALLSGPTALAYTDVTPEGDPGDVVTVAKTLKDFSKDNPELIIKGGLFEGNFIDAAGVNQLADVEPREVLLSKLAGLMAAPMQQFAGLLQAVPRDFAYGLKALIDIGGAPGAPESAPEAPPAEAEAASEEAAPEEAESAPADDAAEETPAAEEEPAAESTETPDEPESSENTESE